MKVTKIETWPLAAQLSSAEGAGENQWYVAIVDIKSEGSILENFAADLRSLFKGSIRQLIARNADELIRLAREERELHLIVRIDESWPREEWRNVDLSRSKLMRAGMTVLVVSEEQVPDVVINAPNLWSWVGGEVWNLRAEGNE